MEQRPQVLPCGCTWRGETQERECVQSSRLRKQMDTLRKAGLVLGEDWYRLAIELERDHTP
jgi:hypothetical protein